MKAKLWPCRALSCVAYTGNTLAIIHCLPMHLCIITGNRVSLYTSATVAVHVHCIHYHSHCVMQENCIGPLPLSHAVLQCVLWIFVNP